MDDDNDFRQLIMRELQNKGQLQEIQAKLRANIFELVKDDINAVDINNCKISKKHQSKELLSLFIVQEYLTSKKLEYTENVFTTESNFNRNNLNKNISIKLNEILNDSGGNGAIGTCKSILEKLIEKYVLDENNCGLLDEIELEEFENDDSVYIEHSTKSNESAEY